MDVGKGKTANTQSFCFQTTDDTKNTKIFVLVTVKRKIRVIRVIRVQKKTIKDKSFRVFRVIRSSKIKIRSKKKIRKIRFFIYPVIEIPMLRGVFVKFNVRPTKSKSPIFAL